MTRLPRWPSRPGAPSWVKSHPLSDLLLLSKEGRRYHCPSPVSLNACDPSGDEHLGSFLSDLGMGESVQYCATKPDISCSLVAPKPISNFATCLHSCRCSARALTLSDSLPPPSPSSPLSNKINNFCPDCSLNAQAGEEIRISVEGRHG